MIHYRIVGRFIGILTLVVALAMASTVGVSYYYQDGQMKNMAISVAIVFVIGALLVWFKPPKEKYIGKREGYLVVAFGWLTMAVMSSLPYMISGTVDHAFEAFFEAVSGLTTTGASIFRDVEVLPESILFWRSLTQWIGGMGIIVLTVAIFPLFGIGGVELFTAEAPGPSTDKIHPTIQGTAKRLWLIYLGLTLACAITLYLAGMTGFDAVNHTFTAMSTGGFSTKNLSVAAYAPNIQYIITLFMFLAGANFTVIYYLLVRKFKMVIRNEEFVVYFFFTVFVTAIFTFNIFYIAPGKYSIEESFRLGIFQVVSLMTTTGFVTADYTSWTPGLTMMSFFLLFVGASAGSTAGGIKMIRHVVFVKHIWNAFRHMLHPRAFIRIKVNESVVPERVVSNILVFLMVYLILFMLGSLFMTVIGMDFISAMSATATSIGNVGPGLGTVGPVHNFSEVPLLGKLVLPFFMILGRLELFTILILFAPYFWKAH